MLDLDSMLHFMMHVNASDLHVKVGSSPMVRIDGILAATNFDIATVADLMQLIEVDLGISGTDFWEKETVYSMSGFGRFRASIYRQRGTYAIVFRRVLTEVKSLKQLGLKGMINSIKDSTAGLYIVSSSSGMGLSSTLAAIVDDINETNRRSIICIEDPIEILIKDKNSIVSQREVGSDIPNIEDGIKKSLRNDPDVLMVSNINNFESLNKILIAVESGIIVCAGVRANGVKETLRSVLSLAALEERQHLISRFNRVLKGIFSQSLVETKDDDGRLPIFESLFVEMDFNFESLLSEDFDITRNPYVSEYISFETSVLDLLENDLIANDVADKYLKIANKDDTIFSI